MRLVGDIETDGFLEVCTTAHCAVLYDWDKKRYLRFNDQTGIKQHPNYAGTLNDAVELLNQAEEQYFHYGHGFDYPALKKLYPNFNPKPTAMFDTIVMATATWRDIKSIDFKRMAKGQYPDDFAKRRLVGSHKLEAWGVRLGVLKGSIADDEGITDWSRWTPEMEDYCEQDVRVTVSLLEKIFEKLDVHPWECHQLDNRFQHLMSRQERQGFMFNVEEATKLYAELQQQLHDIEVELKDVFRPFYKQGKYFVPKRSNSSAGYVAGAPLTKVALTEFNPASRDHIQNRLQKLYGWQPKEFGADGRATVDESVLTGLRHYPSVPLLLDYLLINKRVGQLATGKQAWLKHATEDGRIHGRIDPMGPVTWRCSHSNPNLGQVPGVRVSPEGELLFGLEGGYGAESRGLFTVPDGSLLCGHDGSGLELRCLGHYLARYDQGVYAGIVVDGDVHTTNQEAIGLNLRNNAKTWIYAFLYGAGDFKLGTIVLSDFPEEKQQRFFAKFGSAGREYESAVTGLGRKSRARIVRSIPALGKLVTAVKAKAKAAGYLTALDGRRLEVRSEHAALNTLLQSAGALIMKRWLVILDELLQDAGMVPHQWSHPSVESHYEYVANVHDEAQTEVVEDYVETYDRLAVKAFNLAGEFYNFRCRIDGEGKSGKTWMETH